MSFQNFPEFEIFKRDYPEPPTVITYDIKKNLYDINFSTFLDKYKIYTDMLWIEKTDFKELYEYLYYHYGNNVYGLDSLFYNGIEPLQKLLDEFSECDIDEDSEIRELKFYPELIKHFEEYIADKRKMDEIEDIESLLEYDILEIYENAQILIFVLFIKFLNFSIETVLDENDEEYKEFTKILNIIYNNIYSGIDYKTIYKNICLPFEINIYELLMFIDNCKCYNKNSNIYKTIEKINNKWIDKMSDKLDKYLLMSTEDDKDDSE